MILHKLNLTLRQKIIFLTCGMIFLSCLLIGTFISYRIYHATETIAVNGLASETRLVAQKFEESYHQMANDVRIIQHMPPIEGIIRSRNTGIDPHDGSTYSLWCTRLASIFTSMMQTRPYYTQMRYIGIEDNGRELVRVNRTAHSLETVTPEDLQQKSSEPYFQRGLLLKKDEVFFSEATYNREHKKITANMLPTLRTVVPVYYHNKLFGMVVINANYPLLLEKKFTEIAPAKNTLVTNHAGDYASYDATSKQITFEFHDRYTRNVPEFVSTVKDTSQKEQSFFLNDEVAYAVKINPTPNTQDAFLAIVLSSPKKILLKEAYKTQYETLILAGFITILGILVSALVARRLTSPLQRMASSMINSKGQVANDLAFPSHLRNEIENLSHVFDSLTKNLQQSEAKASDVLNNVIDGIITINKNGIIESYNPACEKIFGYSTQEVIGQNVKMLMPEPYHSEHDQYIKNYKDTGKEKVIGIGREVTGKRKDGSEFPLDLSVSKTWTSGTYIFTGIVRDITERKQMEQMKDEFISTVNHELRTPLTSIQAALGLLKTKTQGKLEKKELRLITLSYNNSKRLSCLVNDILDIEKIAAGKMDYHFEELEIGALVKDIINRHQNLAEKYHIIFSLNLDIPETYCKLDSSRFNQALVNLLSNAAKFSPKGEIVTITVEKHGTANLCVSVTDKGPGVPVDFHSKIFKRFAQADSSSTRAKGGTGLGLNITKSIIEASGGTVAFDSEEGKGARFYFILPICHSEQSQEVG